MSSETGSDILSSGPNVGTGILSKGYTAVIDHLDKRGPRDIHGKTWTREIQLSPGKVTGTLDICPKSRGDGLGVSAQLSNILPTRRPSGIEFLWKFCLTLRIGKGKLEKILYRYEPDSKMQWLPAHYTNISNSWDVPLDKILEHESKFDKAEIHIRVELDYLPGKVLPLMNQTLANSEPQASTTHHREQTTAAAKALGQIFEDQNFALITFSSNEEKDFKVLELLARSMSPAFGRMLDDDMKEKKSRKIPLDMTTEALERLLKFMHTGELSVSSDDDLEQLFDQAECYGFDSLKKALVDVMYERVNFHNAAHYAALAIKFKAGKDHIEPFINFLNSSDNKIQKDKNYHDLMKVWLTMQETEKMED